MRIGQVAGAANIGVETIRFYEREGLIAEPARRPSGYREYEQSVVERLSFIRRAKALGFTLHEIKDLLGLRIDGASTCGQVKARAESRIAQMKAKIAELETMKRGLEGLSAACDAGATTSSECPVLESLEHGSAK